MKNLLKYRNSNYFNSEDLFLIIGSLENYYITRVELHGGSWFTKEGLKYKVTSIKCINCKELYHKEVTYLGTEVKGTMSKFLEPHNIGINWYGGVNIKIYGLPSYWNNPSKLNEVYGN